MSDITVPVPEDRVAEFYQFFGLWLNGSLSLEPAPVEKVEPQREESKAWTNDEESLDDARWLWGKLSKKARNLFSILMEHPAQQYSGPQLAEALDINYGARGVAGTLAWPGRYGIQIGRDLPSEWRWGSEDGVGYYWMEPTVAELFRAARTAG